MKIAVMGLGRVGLPLACVLADSGFEVVGVDIDKKRIEEVNSKKQPFFEKNMQDLMAKYVGNKLVASDDFSVLNSCDAVMITVGTPVRGGVPDLSYVKMAVENIARYVHKGQIIILKSTVPVGTIKNVVKPLLEEKSGLKCESDFFLAYVPERMVEGNAIEELRTLPKLVGGYGEESEKRAKEIFKNISGPDGVITKPVEFIEMMKIVDNAYRYFSISFGNHLKEICDKYNIDANELISTSNHNYPRNAIKLPGPVGGTCLKKDTTMLKYCAEQKGIRSSLLNAVIDINENIIEDIISRAEAKLNEDYKPVKNSRVLILGLGFNGYMPVDDYRDSPSLPIITYFKGKGANVMIHDVCIKKEEISLFGMPVELKQGIETADIIILMHKIPEYYDAVKGKSNVIV